jgi:hypothetical protein
VKKGAFRSLLIILLLILAFSNIAPVQAEIGGTSSDRNYRLPAKKTKPKSKVKVNARAEDIRLKTQNKNAIKAKPKKATIKAKPKAKVKKVNTSAEDIRLNTQNKNAIKAKPRKATATVKTAAKAPKKTKTTNPKLTQSAEDIRLGTQEKAAQSAKKEIIKKRASDTRAEDIRFQKQEKDVIEQKKKVLKERALDTRAEDIRLGTQEKKAKTDALSRGESVRLDAQEKAAQEKIENKTTADDEDSGKSIGDRFWEALDFAGGVTRTAPHAVGLWWNKTTRLGENDELAKESLEAAQGVVKNLEGRIAKGEKLSEGDLQMLNSAKKMIGEDTEILQKSLPQAWQEVGPNSDPVAYSDKYLKNHDVKVIRDNALLIGIGTYIALDVSNLLGGAGAASKAGLLAKAGKIAKVVDVGTDTAKALRTADRISDAQKIAKVAPHLDDAVKVAKKGKTVTLTFGKSKDVFMLTPDLVSDFEKAASAGKVASADEVVKAIAKSRGVSTSKIWKSQDEIIKKGLKEGADIFKSNAKEAKIAVNAAQKSGNAKDLKEAKKGYHLARADYLNALDSSKKSYDVTKIPIKVQKTVNTVAITSVRTTEVFSEVIKRTGLDLASDTGSVAADLLNPFKWGSKKTAVTEMDSAQILKKLQSKEVVAMVDMLLETSTLRLKGEKLKIQECSPTAEKLH